ncbi:MAG TPA: ECF-type sigma factor [Phycisphaerae bacterium]|nr:ECF-type sigma factor [Phycisphaerae bacterium]
MNSTAESVTRILSTAEPHDPQTAAELLPLLYEELRRLARARLRGALPGTTIQPTELVHEAYLRLVGNHDPGWNGRNHFFGAAAQAMRNILVDRARSKATAKRGGGRQRVDAEEIDLAIEPPSDDVLALDEALRNLEKLDPQKSRIALLHCFCGMTHEEIASTLDVSLSTVEREWRFTRALLHAQLSDRSLPAG